MNVADEFHIAGPSLLYRKHTHELVDILREIEKEPGSIWEFILTFSLFCRHQQCVFHSRPTCSVNAKGKSVGLHGRRGVGKSVIMHQLAQYAVQQGW